MYNFKVVPFATMGAKEGGLQTKCVFPFFPASTFEKKNGNS